MVKGIDPESSDTGHLEGEIGFQKLLKVFALPIIHDVVDQVVNLRML